ncbi:DUF5063 domain-containing protein [Marinicella sp. W31]|uniref:DUF5063 domain-containing protein n=1 Tax=Marinicella sp. W31 TaxID=3023713 RepID=UPI003757A9AC
MDIKKTVNEFLDFVLNENNPIEDLGELITALDKLAYSVRYVNYEFDNTDYPDTPEKNYRLIREKVEKRFPTLGFYNTSEDVSENVGTSTIVVGDGIDDICDIVGDLKDVLWCFENTSINNALWHFQFGYRSHWGRHLRELQLYLHDQWS